MNEHLTQALFSSQRKLRTFTYMNSHGSSYYKSWKEYPCTDSKTFVRERGGEICPSVVYMFKGCWATGLNNDRWVAKLSTTWQVLQCYSASGDLYLFRSWPKLTNCNNYQQINTCLYSSHLNGLGFPKRVKEEENTLDRLIHWTPIDETILQ